MTSRPFRFRWRTQTFRANLLDSLCDVLHTYGLDFGLHLRHLRDEYTRKEVGDYYAAMCPISHNILLRLEAVVNRWTKRVTRSRPNQIAGPGPKSGPARKSESRGPENGVSRWRRPNSEIYLQNHHFGLVYDMIYQFLGMETKNYKFGMFCQQCHPSVASGDADIRPRNASRIPTCHLFTS